MYSHHRGFSELNSGGSVKNEQQVTVIFLPRYDEVMNKGGRKYGKRVTLPQLFSDFIKLVSIFKKNLGKKPSSVI